MQVAPIAMENVRDSIQLFPVARSLDEDYAPRSRAARSGRRVLPVALTPRLIPTEFKAAINWARLQVRSNGMIQHDSVTMCCVLVCNSREGQGEDC